MARDPNSMWSPLAENSGARSYTKDLFVVHSTGDRGSALAIYNYFNRPTTVVESTFVIGLGPEDPTRQLMDSAANADANVQANQRGISVEVVGQATDDYTPWQVAELIRLGRWARRTHGIPAQIPATDKGKGFGWHVMFGAPGPWAAVAKECPGKKRIAKLKSTIFPAIFAADNEDDDMPYSEADLRRIIREEANAVVWGRELSKVEGIGPSDLGGFVQHAAVMASRAAAGAGPATIDPAAIAAAIPKDLAKQVVDLLVADLAD